MSTKRKSTRASQRRRKKTVATSFEKLEPRNLLASLSLSVDPVVEDRIFDIRGTNGADTIQITQSGSNITATVGNQSQTYNRSQFDAIRVFAFGGDDVVVNNTSVPSRIFGGQGNDDLTGGSGNDQVFGQPGNDVSRGGAGDDLVSDHAGTNSIFGDAGDDRVFGGTGIDRLFGGAGRDILIGKSGNDFLDPGAGGVLGTPEYAAGGTGNDSLRGGDGYNILAGQTGDDTYTLFEVNTSVRGYDRILERDDQGNDTVDATRLDLRNRRTVANPDREILVYGSRHASIDALGVENIEASTFGVQLANSRNIDTSLRDSTAGRRSFDLIFPSRPTGDFAVEVFDSGSVARVNPYQQIQNANGTYTARYQLTETRIFNGTRFGVLPEGQLTIGGDVNNELNFSFVGDGVFGTARLILGTATPEPPRPNFDLRVELPRRFTPAPNFDQASSIPRDGSVIEFRFSFGATGTFGSRDVLSGNMELQYTDANGNLRTARPTVTFSGNQDDNNLFGGIFDNELIVRYELANLPRTIVRNEPVTNFTIAAGAFVITNEFGSSQSEAFSGRIANSLVGGSSI